LYTESEVEELKNYPEKTVEELAVELGRSKRSIIGKLSRMGIYVKIEYTTKAGLKPISKLELVDIISEHLGVNLEGLEGAPKGVLEKLRRVLLGD